MVSRDAMSGEFRFYEAMRQALSVKLRSLPRGSIYFKQEHGKKRPYVWVDGREKYLSARDVATVRGLMSRAEIERSLKLIGENLLLLEEMRTRYHDFEELIPQTYEYPESGLSRNEISRITAKWEKERARDRLPAELFLNEKFGIDGAAASGKVRKFTTSDGGFVKSKSELVIYEFLRLKGIPFLYENPREINGVTRYPDFTIMRESDGLIILWEHFGMMSLEWYKGDAQKKLWDYAAEGFWPFKNLITTFEFEDGDLNVEEIGRASCRERV